MERFLSPLTSVVIGDGLRSAQTDVVLLAEGLGVRVYLLGTGSSLAIRSLTGWISGFITQRNCDRAG